MDGIELIKDAIRNGTKHPYYKRTVDLAKEYTAFYTGKDIAELLRQIVRRESNEMFEQRKRLTYSMTVPALNSCRSPFDKVTRTKPIYKEYGLKDQLLAEHLDRLAHFYGQKSIEDYIGWVLPELNFFDPNAFIVIEFEPFDSNVEKAKPYPLLATSQQVINFDYDNGTLEWVLIRWTEDKYTLYQGMTTIQFEVVEKHARKSESERYEIQEDEQVLLWVNGNKTWKIEIYEPLSPVVPAYRLGYIMDVETMGATCISIFHQALPLLHKTLKINSELDLSTALVAHPQIIQYANPCTECKDGTTPDGYTCGKCGGTGIAPVSTTVQDAITIRMPRNADEFINLEQLLVYKSPAVDVIKFQSDYVDKLKSDIQKAIFNADIFTRSEISTTATEKNLERDNLDDTLFPFAQKYAETWQFVCRQVAIFTDLETNEPLNIRLEMPKQFKFKTVTELLTDLKTARDAGASAEVISSIQDDINAILYADSPDKLHRIQVKSNFNPWNGYDANSVKYIISTMNEPRKAVQWAYLESIFEDLELEYPELYMFELRKISELVNTKVDEYVQRISDAKPATMLNLGDLPIDNPTE